MIINYNPTSSSVYLQFTLVGEIVIVEDKYALREQSTTYNSISCVENSGLRIENVFY